MIDSPCQVTAAARTPATATVNRSTGTASAARTVMPTRTVDPDTGGSFSKDGRRLTYRTPPCAVKHAAARAAQWHLTAGAPGLPGTPAALSSVADPGRLRCVAGVAREVIV